MFPMFNTKYIAILLIVISNLSCTSNSVTDRNKEDVLENNLNISLNNKILVNEISSNIADLHVSKFKKGYDRIKLGKINEAIVAFEDLKNSHDRTANELGEYGLLITAFETENLPEMLSQINNIKALDNKSGWLKDELLTYKTLYYFTSAKFTKTRSILNNIDKTKVYSNPILSSIETALYIRNNELDNAWDTINNLDFENEYSISQKAYLISITKGNGEVINYLKSKVSQYPDNEYIQLMHNSYLVNKDEHKAKDRAYQLSIRSENPYILIYSIDTLMVNLDRDNEESMNRLDELANKLNNLDSAKEYIDYYIFRIAVPSDFYSMNRNLEIANNFNPKNYRLLLNEYYIYPEDQKLKILKTIESLDPYNHNTIMLLAQFYKHQGMTQELIDINQRFKDSRRIKTDDEIKFMKSI